MPRRQLSLNTPGKNAGNKCYILELSEITLELSKMYIFRVREVANSPLETIRLILTGEQWLEKAANLIKSD